jgi:hypothetical protein
VFLLVDRGERFGAVGAFALRCLVTLALAAASYRWIELPVRAVSWRPRRVAYWAVPIAAMLLIAPAVLIHRPAQVVTDSRDIDPGLAEAVRIRPVAPSGSPLALPSAGTEPSAVSPSAPGSGSGATSTTVTSTATATAQAAPLRLLIVGDSTAAALGAGIVQWALTSPDLVQVKVDASGACGLVRGGDYADDVLNSALHMTCPDLIWSRAISDVSSLRPDIVLILISLADSWPRTWDDGRTWLIPTDDGYESRLTADYSTYFQSLLDHGAPQIVWVRPPVALIPKNDFLPEDSYTNGSQTVIASVVDGLAEAKPSRVLEADLRSWYESGSNARASDRPDGTHMTTDAAARVAAAWLWPFIKGLRDDGP